MYCLKNILFSPANFFSFVTICFFYSERFSFAAETFFLPPPFFFFCNKNFTFSTEITLLLQTFFFLLWRASFLPQIYVFFAVTLFLLPSAFCFTVTFLLSFFCCKLFLPWHFSYWPQDFSLATSIFFFFFFFCCKYFSFITSFFLLPRAFLFCRKLFSFAVTLVGYRKPLL